LSFTEKHVGAAVPHPPGGAQLRQPWPAAPARPSCVILSGTIPFACEWDGEVEGPLAVPQCWRCSMKLEKCWPASVARDEKLVGVLRLRDGFALRSRHSAQDDKALAQDDKALNDTGN